MPAQPLLVQAAESKERPEHPSFRLLGVRVDAVQIADVVDQMKEWIHKRRGCHSIAATGMNGIVEAQHDPEFKQILNATDLIVPDGMPLIWLGRHQGHVLPRRVYGPDLLLAFCEKTAGRGYRHFFYGAEREPGVPERLAEKLKQRFPGTIVAGTYSRPFESAGLETEDEILSRVTRAAPDVLWVGLGELRQVRWMYEHRNKLNVPVVVGVGAAFDMISGRRRQAPRWMREYGLEWLFRLIQEPRRLWRRYLIYGTEFVAWIVLESLGLKKSATSTNDGTPQPNSLP
jgi:N-acetylglucosaminyldiphosphoundecaprenol N-acetyl-beta-D-mannosaminyltransferase